MQKPRFAFLLSLLVLTVGTSFAQQAGRRSPITEFGAVGDGKTLNTKAIQRAIDETATAGGGTVVIPAGTFMSGSIFLKPKVNLHVEKDGVLKGTENIVDYPKMETRIEGHFQQWIPALVNAEKIDGLRITGEGTLDGSGAVYYQAFRSAIGTNRGTKNLDVDRPRMMFIRESKDVVVSGLHFLNSGFWNLHLYKCDGVIVDGLDINALPGSPSTDGIDVDSSRNITIRNCTIANNDDCIALKGTKGPLAMEDKTSPPVENIRVENCTFVRGGSFVTCGSEATIVRNVVVENCRATSTAGRGMSVLRLKLRTDTPQDYSDMHFRNITLEGQGNIISVAPWSQYFDLQGHPQPSRKAHNITMTDIKGTFGAFGSIRPAPGDVLDGFTFENIDVKVATPPNFQGITNVVFKNVKINGETYTAPPATQPAQQ